MRAQRGQVVATIKIIPFAVSAQVMRNVDAVLAENGTAVSLSPFTPFTAVLVNTTLPSLKKSVIEKTTDLTQRRLAAVGGSVRRIVTCAHETAAVGSAIEDALKAGSDLIVIVGASVTVDRADAVPAGIVSAGGKVEHFGMPVDPGNMMVLARHGETPVLVLPGCARSPKLNGIDWVLERTAAGLPVTPRDVMAMGVGGLLVDSPARPLPRDEAVRERPSREHHRKIAGLVLAAGQSRRMGKINKLLEKIVGVPLVRRSVDTVAGAGLDPVIVVTGHEQDAVAAALKGTPAVLVHNPAYAEGLSTSLKAGLAALPDDCDAAVICLADMPAIAPKHIKALTARFDPDAGRAIGVPVYAGKRGNPILWDRRFWASMQDVSGDVGARHLIGEHGDLVYEVEFDDTSVVTDLDTPEQLAKYRESEGDEQAGG